MVITVTILNSSVADLVVSQGALTGGTWQGPPPVPGQILPNRVDYTNAGSAFAPVGGYINLAPAGGGTVTLSWSWTPGHATIAFGNVVGTDALALSYSVINASTFAPSVIFLITNAASDDASGGHPWRLVNTA